jgi:hypothetical protein
VTESVLSHGIVTDLLFLDTTITALVRGIPTGHSRHGAAMEPI